MDWRIAYHLSSVSQCKVINNQQNPLQPVKECRPVELLAIMFEVVVTRLQANMKSILELLDCWPYPLNFFFYKTDEKSCIHVLLTSRSFGNNSEKESAVSCHDDRRQQRDLVRIAFTANAKCEIRVFVFLKY